jgi:hypothetical protein
VPCRNAKSLVVASLESHGQLEIPLPKGGSAFWLGPTTLGHVVPDTDAKTSALYVISVRVETEGEGEVLSTPAPPTLLGTFPTASVSNFVYAPKAGTLVFSDSVYADGDLSRVREGDDAWDARGHSAFVYDGGFERHWDTWTTPKKPSLFTVPLAQDADGTWTFGDEFTNVLKGTGHVRPSVPASRACPLI